MKAVNEDGQQQDLWLGRKADTSKPRLAMLERSQDFENEAITMSRLVECSQVRHFLSHFARLFKAFQVFLKAFSMLFGSLPGLGSLSQWLFTCSHEHVALRTSQCPSILPRLFATELQRIASQ